MSLSAMAQSGTGTISGTAQDASGAVLPGVSVTLVNQGTLGGNQVAVTDARGAYQFTRLVPGSYSVRGELAGFRSVLHENVVVNADVTARVDVRLEVGDISETLTVTGQAPLVDTSSALNLTVLDRTVIATLPARNDLWGIGRTVPSVIMNKYDVGGSESFSDSGSFVHGASERNEGAFTIDGMEVSCGTSAGSSSCMYSDPFGYEEINYQAGNAPAESARGGLVYSMVTKTGTNAYHAAFTSTGSNQDLQSNNITPALRRDLLAGVPAKALAANPNLSPGAKILHIYNVAANASGPILRDRLWWAASGDYGELDQLVVGSYNPDGTQYVDDNFRKSYSFKLSWQMAPSHQLHFYELMVQKAALHRPADNATQFYESRAAIYQYPNIKHNQQLRWTGTLSPRLFAEVGASLQKGPIIAPERPEVKHGDLPRFDSVTQTNMVARPTYNWNPQYRAFVQSSLTYVLSGHDFKFGYQFNRGYTHDQVYSVSHYPSGLRAIYRDGVPDSVNTYNTPTDFELWENNHSVYAQDRWRPVRKVTISAGLRLQKTTGGSPAACQVQTVFIDAQCFAEIKNVPNFLDLSPRVSLIYDIFGDGRTALKLTANRYLVGLGTGYTGRVNPLRVTNDTRSWTDRNGDLIPQLDELGLSSGFNLGTTNRYSADIVRPISNELSVALEHQLPGAVAVSVGYYHREIRREIGSRNMAVPMESYIPIQVVERSSGQPVTVFNQDPTLRGRFDTLWDNYPEMDSDYNGIEVTVRKRLSNRWMVMGGGSYGKNTGDIYGASADLNNPNFTFRRGVLGQDVPLMLKLSGLYELPYGISVSGSAQHFSGFPETDTVSVGRDTVTLTQVTQSLTVAPSGTHRLPSVKMVDLSVRKTFRRGRTSIEPVIDLFNIGNTGTVTRRTSQLGPAHGRVVSILRARMVKFGVNVNY
jgi:hypothetical protein